jgi:hypothetical protein
MLVTCWKLHRGADANHVLQIAHIPRAAKGVSRSA